MTTTLSLRQIGTSCPWHTVAPADLSPIARTLEAARTRPHVRAMLAAEAGGTTPPEPPIPAASEVVTFAGVTLHAPGYTNDQFDRAIMRALVDELQVKPYSGGRWLVHHPGLTSGYVVSRERCTCKAGSVGTPCKHRALICLHEQVRMPAQRKQWAKLNSERPARKAVA